MSPFDTNDYRYFFCLCVVCVAAVAVDAFDIAPVVVVAAPILPQKSFLSNSNSSVFFLKKKIFLQIYIRDQDTVSSTNRPQRLHIIDRVLRPLQLKEAREDSPPPATPSPLSPSRAFVGLTAGKLRREQGLVDLGQVGGE